jgi:queuine tRNA-ribosyltransferase
MKSKEYLGLTIASVHNLAFYLWLVKQARLHIIKGDFEGWKNEMVIQLQHKL